MNGLTVDKDTFAKLTDKDQHLVLYDLIRATHEKALNQTIMCEPEKCIGIKGLWTHIKIQWWWLSAVSLAILAGALVIIRSAS